MEGKGNFYPVYLIIGAEGKLLRFANVGEGDGGGSKRESVAEVKDGWGMKGKVLNHIELMKLHPQYILIEEKRPARPAQMDQEPKNQASQTWRKL
ncbi:hypothetical protein AMTR_s00060p00080800 [Amborella trichopoda]|uniref:Uncharacterized protein n=1 Tax=Amborella trichopoda TaxID=13333 RepID=W1NJ77_AMBTC|nr:hypothetical protein AMTR_s00060p00080800 [Amborella trichopoda]